MKDLQTRLQKQEASKTHPLGRVNQAKDAQTDLTTRYKEQDPGMQPAWTITLSRPPADISEP